MKDCELLEIKKTKIHGLVKDISDFYLNLLGYSPENTNLELINEEEWNSFCDKMGSKKDSNGIFLPRNQNAIIPIHISSPEMSLFHEYFGHGLYCERTQDGRKLVDLEKILLDQEKDYFGGKNFSREDLERFRRDNFIAKELKKLRERNLSFYEMFAIWSEFFLSDKMGFKEGFKLKYDKIDRKNEDSFNSLVSFQRSYGDLAVFYEFGLARKMTSERVRNLLLDIYKEKIKDVRFALVYGSRKEFSDIDLFVVGEDIPEVNRDWLDVRVYSPFEFEKGIENFDISVTDPILTGELVIGDKIYLDKKILQLKNQPITKESISHNYKNSKKQRELALRYPQNTPEHKKGMDYYYTYRFNGNLLNNGKKILTQSELMNFLPNNSVTIFYSDSQSEKFIELKGGIIK